MSSGKTYKSLRISTLGNVNDENKKINNFFLKKLNNDNKIHTEHNYNFHILNTDSNLGSSKKIFKSYTNRIGYTSSSKNMKNITKNLNIKNILNENKISDTNNTIVNNNFINNYINTKNGNTLSDNLFFTKIESAKGINCHKPICNNTNTDNNNQNNSNINDLRKKDETPDLIDNKINNGKFSTPYIIKTVRGSLTKKQEYSKRKTSQNHLLTEENKPSIRTDIFNTQNNLNNPSINSSNFKNKTFRHSSSKKKKYSETNFKTRSTKNIENDELKNTNHNNPESNSKAINSFSIPSNKIINSKLSLQRKNDSYKKLKDFMNFNSDKHLQFSNLILKKNTPNCNTNSQYKIATNPQVNANLINNKNTNIPINDCLNNEMNSDFTARDKKQSNKNITSLNENNYIHNFSSNGNKPEEVLSDETQSDDKNTINNFDIKEIKIKTASNIPSRNSFSLHNVSNDINFNPSNNQIELEKLFEKKEQEKIIEDNNSIRNAIEITNFHSFGINSNEVINSIDNKKIDLSFDNKISIDSESENENNNQNDPFSENVLNQNLIENIKGLDPEISYKETQSRGEKMEEIMDKGENNDYSGIKTIFNIGEIMEENNIIINKENLGKNIIPNSINIENKININKSCINEENFYNSIKSSYDNCSKSSPSASASTSANESITDSISPKDTTSTINITNENINNAKENLPQSNNHYSLNCKTQANLISKKPSLIISKTERVNCGISNNNKNNVISVSSLISNKNIQISLSNLNLNFNGYEATKYSNKPSNIIRAYAANTYQGIIRNYNEDRVSIILNIAKAPNFKGGNWPKCSFFGIYDGHGGSLCADFLRDKLHTYVIRDSNFPLDPRQAIKSGFEKAETDFIKEYAITKENTLLDKSGSCAVVALIVDDVCYIANVGDSRAILSSDEGRKITALTLDHKPNEEGENKRIIENGGKVSRTFGDIEAKHPIFGGMPGVVVATPEIGCFKIDKKTDYLILGCDGIFDQLSNEDCIESVWLAVKNKMKEINLNIHCAAGVDMIMKSALVRRTLDNITCLIVAFENMEHLVKTNNQKLLELERLSPKSSLYLSNVIENKEDLIDNNNENNNKNNNEDHKEEIRSNHSEKNSKEEYSNIKSEHISITISERNRNQSENLIFSEDIIPDKEYSEKEKNVYCLTDVGSGIRHLENKVRKNKLNLQIDISNINKTYDLNSNRYNIISNNKNVPNLNSLITPKHIKESYVKQRNALINDQNFMYNNNFISKEMLNDAPINDHLKNNLTSDFNLKLNDKTNMSHKGYIDQIGEFNDPTNIKRSKNNHTISKFNTHKPEENIDLAKIREISDSKKSFNLFKNKFVEISENSNMNNIQSNRNNIYNKKTHNNNVNCLDNNDYSNNVMNTDAGFGNKNSFSGFFSLRRLDSANKNSQTRKPNSQERFNSDTYINGQLQEFSRHSDKLVNGLKKNEKGSKNDHSNISLNFKNKHSHRLNTRNFNDFSSKNVLLTDNFVAPVNLHHSKENFAYLNTDNNHNTEKNSIQLDLNTNVHENFDSLISPKFKKIEDFLKGYNKMSTGSLSKNHVNNSLKGKNFTFKISANQIQNK